MQIATRLLSRVAEYVERKTLQAHLDAVLAELESRDLWHLKLSQRKARSQAINRLRAYRDRGVFPKNYSSKHRVPSLRDVHGTSCAVAFLMEESGRKEVVDRLVGQDNGLYLENANDPELLAWLEESGLTHEEACAIQMPYSPMNYDITHLPNALNGLPHKVGPMVRLVKPWIPPAPPAPDWTWLYMVATITVGAGVWLAYRWFYLRPQLKRTFPAPAVLPPLVYERRAGVESAVRELTAV